MSLSSTRRTTGIMKNMVGAAMAQEIIQEAIQLDTILASQPSTR